ncbi:MAG: curlin [Alphaproteobacteria bacterium]|nr:curlin [Alphaproteobacteria bacterium]
MKRFNTIALALGLSIAAALPSFAGGQISFQFNARNAEEARGVRTILALYSISKAIDSGANISQSGNNNAAGIGQFGRGNFGVIEQQGNGHNATLSQRGNDNSYGIFQFGTGTSGQVSQTGNNGAGFLFQQGW